MGFRRWCRFVGGIVGLRRRWCRLIFFVFRLTRGLFVFTMTIAQLMLLSNVSLFPTTTKALVASLPSAIFKLNDFWFALLVRRRFVEFDRIGCRWQWSILGCDQGIILCLEGGELGLHVLQGGCKERI